MRTIVKRVLKMNHDNDTRNVPGFDCPGNKTYAHPQPHRRWPAATYQRLLRVGGRSRVHTSTPPPPPPSQRHPVLPSDRESNENIYDEVIDSESDT